MNHWLLKSEPSSYSWQQLVADKRTSWNGVRNHQASNNMKAMKKGDRAFFYHSGEGKEIVGVVEVTREHFPDPTDKTQAFVAVDMKAVAPMPKPVTLAAARGEPQLADMALLKQSRLSVQPVTAAEWKLICAMGGLKSI
jgi:predicted RNA-binding protein with PUA-like domain